MTTEPERKGKHMSRIDIKRFALGFGTTGALLYLGCVLVMAVAG